MTKQHKFQVEIKFTSNNIGTSHEPRTYSILHEAEYDHDLWVDLAAICGLNPYEELRNIAVHEFMRDYGLSGVVGDADPSKFKVFESEYTEVPEKHIVPEKI